MIQVVTHSFVYVCVRVCVCMHVWVFVCACAYAVRMREETCTLVNQNNSATEADLCATLAFLFNFVSILLLTFHPKTNENISHCIHLQRVQFVLLDDFSRQDVEIFSRSRNGRERQLLAIIPFAVFEGLLELFRFYRNSQMSNHCTLVSLLCKLVSVLCHYSSGSVL